MRETDSPQLHASIFPSGPFDRITLNFAAQSISEFKILIRISPKCPRPWQKVHNVLQTPDWQRVAHHYSPSTPYFSRFSAPVSIPVSWLIPSRREFGRNAGSSNSCNNGRTHNAIGADHEAVIKNELQNWPDICATVFYTFRFF
jgi:hypothetical protein